MTYYRSFIEINRKNLIDNYSKLKALAGDSRFVAVIKANAYGHDSVLIAKTLNEVGVFNFAVASIDEALVLRKAQVKGEILLLGYTSKEDLNCAIDNGLTISLLDYEYSKDINKQINRKIKAFIQINSGLNRLGYKYDDLEKIKASFKFENINIKGIYSHLASADSDDLKAINYVHQQKTHFDQVLKELKEANLSYGIASLQASYGLVNYPHFTYDAVRIGMLLYGVDISEKAYRANSLDLKPVLSLKSHIIEIQEIKSGEYISYGLAFQALKPMRIATVSIGYKDGYNRLLAKDNYVLINGRYAKIIGKICMDQLMIDITDIDCKVDDIVTLIGEDKPIKADHLASSIDSISAELLACLSRHLPRILV